MSTAAATTSRRWTAAERREAIVEAAIAEFAGAGLGGVSTEAIARRAGISHAYLFRLFRSKRELFLAAIERCFDRVEHAFDAALQADGEDDPLLAVGRAYKGLLADRTELLFQLQAYAACGDDDVRALVRRRYAALVRWVMAASGGDEESVQRFFGHGMVCNVVAALALDEPGDDAEVLRRLMPPRDQSGC